MAKEAIVEQKTRLVFEKVLIKRDGQGQNGKDWVVLEVLTTTTGNYPKPLAINIFRIEDVQKVEKFVAGTVFEAYCTPSSREYNGKWYTEVRAAMVWEIRGEQGVGF